MRKLIQMGDCTQEMRNSTVISEMSQNDAAWILSNAFRIMTMQSGFALLEAGYVSSKNIANIMVKNMVDIALGGVTFWSFGYGLIFGEPSNPFCGLGDFFVRSKNKDQLGALFVHYIFHFCFASTATTIVSGAVAERMLLSAYMIFSVFNTFVYVFPASWAWNPVGFLFSLGFHDFAGACVVHVTGGVSALVAAKMLGPRIGRFGRKDNYGLSSPVTALTGTFMLWWAWMAFNCGSTLGVQQHLWKLSAKIGINTLNGSIGGCITSILASMVVHRMTCYDISFMITGTLGGLVGITAGCAVFSPVESLFVGSAGALAALGMAELLERLHIDDPVGASPVHFGAGVLATLAVGICCDDEFNVTGRCAKGLLYGGGFKLLLIQLLGAVATTVWSGVLTAIGLFVIDTAVGLRMTVDEELMGADMTEHKVHVLATTKAKPHHDDRHQSTPNQYPNNDGPSSLNINNVEQLVRDLIVDLGRRETTGPSGSVSSLQRRRSTIHHRNRTEPTAEAEALASIVHNLEQLKGDAGVLRGIPHQSVRLPGAPAEVISANGVTKTTRASMAPIPEGSVAISTFHS